jgi:hypothetical protein
MATGNGIVSGTANLCINELVCQSIIHRQKNYRYKKAFASYLAKAFLIMI